MSTERYKTEFKRTAAANIDLGIVVFFGFIMLGIIQSTGSASLKQVLQLAVVFVPIICSVILDYKFGQTLGMVAFSMPLPFSL